MPTETPCADLTIAINRAALIHRFHWWACMDLETITENPQVDAYRLFTCKETCKRAKKRNVQLPKTLMIAEEQAIVPSRKALGWSLYTSTSSMALAYHLGARDIRVYGADMNGEADWDGTLNERTARSEKRWEKERGIIRLLDDWFTRNGATLQIVGVDQCQTLMK